jgi:hypothetical protein
MKSTPKILRNSLIGNKERLLWSKYEPGMGSLEAGSNQEREGAHMEWVEMVQLWAWRQVVIKTTQYTT